jgi:hypothetical protein
VTLVVSESACHAVNAEAHHDYCTPNLKTKHGLITELRIQSRVGLQMLILLKPQRNEGDDDCAYKTKLDKIEGWRKVVLPKDQVLSWTYENPVIGNSVKQEDVCKK